MSTLLFTAWRNFLRNPKRYRVLLSAIILITAVLTMVVAVVLGLRENLYEKASRYFAGNVVVMGYDGSGDSQIDRPEEVLEDVRSLESGGFELRAHSRRSTYYDHQNIELFFSGYYMKQRRMVGVEWELERPLLERFDFASGGVPQAGDESAVLISSATAEKLRIEVGDQLLVKIRSDRGRTNTAELVVRGIFAESSFFGYQPYIHRRALNRLREAPEDRVNEIGLYLKDPIANEAQAAKALAEELSQRVPTFGLMESRQAYSDQSRAKRDLREYGVVTVGAQLEEIEELLGAMSLIAGLIIVMFLGIVVVGVGNTFTMIVWERTREIGTLRALGMQSSRAVISFLFEAAILGIVGAGLGILFGVGLLEALRRGYQFAPDLVTSLFLTKGRLVWNLPLRAILAVTGLMLAAGLLGSLRAALRAGRMHPVEALQRHK